MPTQKFVIQYESDKPILPINTFQYPLNKGYEKENLRILHDMLYFILRRLQFIPLNKSITETTAKCKRTELREFYNLSL